jgi:hypothetical protein
MSPTVPTFATLNDQLTKARRRIRELEARETELLAHNRTLRAVITEITHADHPRITAELTSSSRSQAPAQTPAPTGASGTGTNRIETKRFPYV